MVYSITVSPRAQKEIENAIDYYALYSDDAPEKFVQSLRAAFDTLAENPFCRFRYKNVRSIKLNRFPYSLYFTLDEVQYIVKILSCFHNKRNPNSRP
jgi:toxin ParE1/3/4